MNKPRHRYSEKSAINSRQLVLKILTEFDKNPGNLEKTIEKGLNNTHIDHRDRRFVFEIVYGVIRHKKTLDYAVDQYVSEKIKDNALYRILRIGAYQLLYMDKVPDHAAVNESVKLAKNDIRTERYSGIVNAVMRAIINSNKVITFPDPQKDLVERLSIEFSHPGWMIERWLKRLGLARTKRLLSFNNEKPSIYLRRKLRDISRQQFESDARTISEPAAGYMNLYYKLKKTLLPESLRMIQQGMCVVQAPSSGWIVALLDVKKGEHLLDMCSAPGGKTALISELTGDTGTVVASELRKSRLISVVEMTRRMDLHNVYPLVCDGEHLPYTGVFDKVLLDAPCTGTGILHRHPEARWIKNPEDIEKLADLQKRLLNSAASAVATGGVLVYSTCSIEPEENQMQVESFLKTHPEFILDHIPDSIPDKFVDDSGHLFISPYEHDMDGMFGARLKRVV